MPIITVIGMDGSGENAARRRLRSRAGDLPRLQRIPPPDQFVGEVEHPIEVPHQGVEPFISRLGSPYHGHLASQDGNLLEAFVHQAHFEGDFFFFVHGLSLVPAAGRAGRQVRQVVLGVFLYFTSAMTATTSETSETSTATAPIITFAVLAMRL